MNRLILLVLALSTLFGCNYDPEIAFPTLTDGFGDRDYVLNAGPAGVTICENSSPSDKLGEEYVRNLSGCRDMTWEQLRAEYPNELKRIEDCKAMWADTIR